MDDSQEWIDNYGKGRFMRRLRWRLRRAGSLVFVGMLLGLVVGVLVMPLLARWF